jgi:hypothetical protein
MLPKRRFGRAQFLGKTLFKVLSRGFKVKIFRKLRVSKSWQ